MSFFAAYYLNVNRYMLKPPHTGGTIPLEFKGKGQLLAWPFDKSGHYSGDDNGHVPGQTYPITAYTENLANSRAVLLFFGLIGCLVLCWMFFKFFGRNKQATSRSRKKKKSRKKGAVNKDDTVKNAKSSDGKWIGKNLWVSNDEIGRGSNGTVVLEGFYEGRPVAVKRLLHAHHDVALKEIKNLIASDQHPNIVRLYGVEQDADFVYISLERCSCSLADLILFSSGEASGADFGVRFSVSGKGMDKDMVLWRENGHPSPQLLKLMRLVA